MTIFRKLTRRAVPVLFASFALAATLLLVPVASAHSANASTGKFLVGVVSISTTDYGNHETILGIEAAAAKRGWSVDVINANGSADLANSSIEDLVTRHAGAIMDLVFPATSLAAGLSAARAAHIPVATWGGGIAPGVVVADGGGGPFATPVVNYMVKQMGGKGSVLALTYHVGLVCIQREDVFLSILKAYPKISVTKDEITIPGYTTEAPGDATSWLASRPKGSQPLAIWGCWEDPTTATLSTLKVEGRTDVKTYGENGGVTAISDVLHGTMTATDWENDQVEGQTLVNEVAASIKAGSSWKPKSVNVAGVLVTKSNVRTFIKQHAALFPGL
jgi:ribose transport system substrate-binding protein